MFFLFSQFIYEGIPYMTAEDEVRLRQDLSDGILLRAFERDVPFRDEDLVKDEFRLPF